MILTAVSILFLVMGIVVATDINKLNMPNGWENSNDGVYRQVVKNIGSDGYFMNIQKLNDTIKNDFYNHPSSSTHIVDKGNNTFTFTDAKAGSFEVVEIDGEKYFVMFWTAYSNDGNVNEAYDFMMQFNNLNGFEPVEA